MCKVVSASSEDKSLHLSGSPNARDFGGYPTNSGKKIRKGCLFRSGRLTDLTLSDQQRLQELNIKRIVDLRGVDESTANTSALNNISDLTVSHMPIEPGNYDEFMRRVDHQLLTYDMMFEQMKGIYRELALEHSKKFKPIFEMLLDTDGGVLIHCSAGKDRTGFAAALILLTLDVPRDTVMKDYMLSLLYYPPAGEVERLRKDYAQYFANIEDKEVLNAVLEVNEAYLLEAFSAVEEHFGDMNNYLESQLGVDDKCRQQLQEKYTHA